MTPAQHGVERERGTPPHPVVDDLPNPANTASLLSSLRISHTIAQTAFIMASLSPAAAANDTSANGQAAAGQNTGAASRRTRGHSAMVRAWGRTLGCGQRWLLWLLAAAVDGVVGC